LQGDTTQPEWPYRIIRVRGEVGKEDLSSGRTGNKSDFMTNSRWEERGGNSWGQTIWRIKKPEARLKVRPRLSRVEIVREEWEGGEAKSGRPFEVTAIGTRLIQERDPSTGSWKGRS